MPNLSSILIATLCLAGLSTQAQAAQHDKASTTNGRAMKLVSNGHATTGKRVALVIGNGSYQYPDSLPKLANPTHDAEDIAAALRGFGFEVIERKDQSLEGMNDAIAEFGRKISDSEAALFYFAGHGLQVKGQNYIIPVDAKIDSEAQVPYRSINVNQLLDEMENGKSRANIVMLDACRNNPISGKFRSGATRGLAAPTSQPKGTIIVYATDPGNVAADGGGRNGLFTAGLLTAFKGNDLTLHGVLVRASKEVERGSERKQTPYINGPATLQEEFQFAPGKTQPIESLPSPTLPATHIKSNEEIEQEGWESARSSGNVDAMSEYLNQYPKGRFAGQAKILLATLKAAPAQTDEPAAPAMLGEWQLEYVSTGGCSYKEAILTVNSNAGAGIYRGQLSFLICGKSVAIVQDALIRTNGSNVAITFTNPHGSDGSAVNYSPDNFVLERKPGNKLVGFNKDSNGKGKDVLLIKR